jgi:hypothetical protein
MTTLTTQTALAAATTSDGHKALAEAARRLAEARQAVAGHRAAVDRARQFADQAAAVVVNLEGELEHAREQHAAALAEAAGANTKPPTSNIRAARAALEAAKDEAEAAADALERVGAIDSASIDVAICEINLRIARCNVLAPIISEMATRIAGARATISNCKHVARALSAADPIAVDSDDYAVAAKLRELADVTITMQKTIDDALASTIIIDSARVARWDDGNSSCSPTRVRWRRSERWKKESRRRRSRTTSGPTSREPPGRGRRRELVERSGETSTGRRYTKPPTPWSRACWACRSCTSSRPVMTRTFARAAG